MPIRHGILLTLALASSAGAQRAALPQLRLQEEWRIGGDTRACREVGWAIVAPDGRFILAPRTGTAGSVTAFDSSGKKTLWEIKLAWGRDSDLRSVNHLGWMGPTLWVHDRNFDQVALIAPDGKITKSLEDPSLLRPTLSDRRKYPVFEDAEVMAVYADGTMLVYPSRRQNFVDTPDYDSTVTHLLRIRNSATIERTIARLPLDPRVTVKDGKRSNTYYPLFANRSLWAVSPDGMRIVMAMAAMSGKDSATIGVVTLNERGDTVFAKRYPFAPERITAKSRDSATARIDDFGNAKTEVPKLYAPFFMPATGLFVGRDRTIWLALRPSPADTTMRPRLILDPAGVPIGIVHSPTNVGFLTGDREHVWATIREGTKIIAVVRYKLVPAR